MSNTPKAIYKRELRAKKSAERRAFRASDRDAIVSDILTDMINKAVGKSLRRASNKRKKQRYKERHPDRVKKQNASNFKQHYAKNRDKILAGNAEWQKNNPKKKAASDLKCMRNRRKDPVQKLRDTCRARIHAFLNSKGKKKDGTSEKFIGCSFEELNEKLSRGKGDHIDHIFPLDAYKVMDEREQLMAMNFANLQVLTKEENLDKANKLPTKEMADKVPLHLWPDGITREMLPDIYPGWASALHR